MKIVFYTNQGSRNKNEDALLIEDIIISQANMSKPTEKNLEINKPVIFAIADGIGGRPGGEIASNEILNTLKNYKDFFIKFDYKFLLEKFIKNLQKYLQENPDLEGMGTTLSSVGINKNKFFILHIGDTRIYSWTEENLQILTIDHTHAQELFEKGFIKFEEIPQHPLRNYLKSALTTNIDVSKIEFQFNLYDYKNQNFFLCTDGVWENLTEKKIKQILLKKEDLYQKAEKIVNLCIKNQTRDNFSFILIETLN